MLRGAPAGGEQGAMAHLPLHLGCCVHLSNSVHPNCLSVHRSAFTNGSSGGATLNWNAPNPAKLAGLRLTVSAASGCTKGNQRPLLQADPTTGSQVFFSAVRSLGALEKNGLRAWAALDAGTLAPMWPQAWPKSDYQLLDGERG